MVPYRQNVISYLKATIDCCVVCNGLVVIEPLPMFPSCATAALYNCKTLLAAEMQTRIIQLFSQRIIYDVWVWVPLWDADSAINTNCALEFYNPIITQ